MQFLSLSGAIKIAMSEPGFSPSHAFDREKSDFHYLTVEARDELGEGNRNTVELLLHLVDVNDNAPVFRSRAFEGRVAESASVGSLVLVSNTHSPLVIKATDRDTGINSLLYYEIMEEHARRFFDVDESTGAVRTVSALDYETQSSFEFNVRVSDRGTPRLSSESLAMVRIDITDENDSPPKFDHAEYRNVLLLPTYADVVVVQLNASDPDTGVDTVLRLVSERVRT